MVQTIKFSQFASGGDLAPGDITVGLLNGNAQFTNPAPLLATGNTATRPAITPAIYYRLRFNTDIASFEYYSPVAVAWIQIEDSDDVLEITGTANQVLANNTSGVPQVGAVTLTTPQNIGLTSAVQFASVQFNTNNGLLDSNGNIILGLVPLTSAVDYVVVRNTGTVLDPTGAGPALFVQGADANIPFGIQSLGTGVIRLSSAATSEQFRFSAGTAYQHAVSFSFPDTANDLIATWQDSNGTVAWLSNIPGTSANTIVIAGTTLNPAAVNTTYVIGNAGQTTITLPAGFNPGDSIIIMGFGAAGWILAANTGDTIQFGQQATSSGGSLTSAGNFDVIKVSGLVANTTWTVTEAVTTGFTFA